MPAAKMSGNYAAKVLKELEERDNNKDRGAAIRDLNKEINGYLKFDTDNLMMNMNNAFEGKKAYDTTPKKIETEQDSRVKAILAEVGKKDALESIMEEHGEYIRDQEDKGGQLALYKPPTQEERKARNENLKK